MIAPAAATERVGSRSSGQATRRNTSLHAIIWLGVAITALGLSGVTGWTTWDARLRTLERASADAENLARVLTQHTERMVDSVDMLLKLTARELGPNSADPIRRSAATATLAYLTQELPHVLALRVLNGDSAETLYEFDKVQVSGDAADRDACDVHRGERRFGIHIGRPVQDAISGAWMVGISRRISGRDGIPGNVVIAYVSLDYVQRLYERVEVGRQGTIALVRTDGTILARQPEFLAYVGSNISDSVLFREKLLQAEEGTYQAHAVSDGKMRIFGYRHLYDLPLVVSVGIMKSEVLAPWIGDAKRNAAFAFTAIAVLALLGWILSREVRRRDSAEMALVRSETRLRLALHAGRMVAWDLDRNSGFITRSPNAQELMGIGSGTLEDFLERIHPDDRPKLKAAIETSFTGEIASIEFRYRRPDGGERWLEVRADESIDDSGASRVIGMTFDVTERRRSEEDLRLAVERAEEAQAQAEEANRAKTDFLASMSHEIRTPLNAVMGFTNLILDRWDLPGEVRRQLALIETSSATLLTVVNDVLDFSKIEAGAIELDPKPFLPDALVRDCLSMVDELATRKNLELTCKTDPALPGRLIGDVPRLRQILLNLLNNAIKFTPSGQVALTVTRQGETGERLRFAVQDTGIGIPADKQARLFHRFSQVDSSMSRQYGGTGLGLAICKRLVELMGGEIGFESEPGRGSTFWFEVPLAAAPALEAQAAQEVPEQARRPARILLAEDVAINQEIARAVLEAAGHVVTVVSDGAEAVMAVQRAGYDLVLMDVQMPVMDGIAATRHIRALDGLVARIPIIAMTANVYAEQIQAFLAAGMDDHVGKPFQRTELYETIERWVPDRNAQARTTNPAA